MKDRTTELRRGLRAAGAQITPAGKGMFVLAVLFVLVVWVISNVSPPGAVPKFQIVAKQGAILSIVVDEKVAADDAALLRIADSLVPKMHIRGVQLQVWTDARMVPARFLDTWTDAQTAARRALVTVNLNTGFRKVEGRVK